MYVHQRKDRQGRVYFSFSYVEGKSGKRVRLRKGQHPHFSDRADAEAWAKSQAGIRAAEAAWHLRKAAWRAQFNDLGEYLKVYTKWQKKKAPNSWRNSVASLEHYVFPFFATKKQSNNINQWHLFYQEFVDWLGDEAETAGRTPGRITKGTANGVIRALNTFMTCMRTYNRLDADLVAKCPSFPEHELNRMGFEHVIQVDEMNRVWEQLKRIDDAVADFFLVLWHTGMRYSELAGLPLTALFRGNIPSPALHDELKKCNVTYHGYIHLESQPATDDCRREEDGSLKRKPLKACKEISPRFTRNIPIRTKEVWNILATRHKEALKSFAKKVFTKEKGDYLLFADLEWNRATNSLRRAFAELGLDAKGFHACRHSFTTNLVGETRSFFLVRAITGHRKDKSFERYLHTFEQISQEARRNEQEIETI